MGQTKRLRGCSLGVSAAAGLVLGASALLAGAPAGAQVPILPNGAVLPNGALNARQHHWGYDYYPNYSGYDFYYGSADEGTYGDGQLHPWHVQGKVWLIAGEPDESNVVVQIGNDGVLVVDTGSAQMAPQLLALIRGLAAQYGGDEKQIRWVINTDERMDHVGGNQVIRQGGSRGPGFILGPAGPAGATVVASENTLADLVALGAPQGLWPEEAHEEPSYSWNYNDEAVTLHLPPSANTNGNLLVRFLGSDVLATGDIVSETSYPIIDEKHGGTIDGELAALNQALDLAVVSWHNGPEEGGTILIPGHGRMIDQTELLNYTIMVTTLRNQIMFYKNRGKTLQQVLAMKLTSGYDARWGADRAWTSEDFVKAVYDTLPTRGKGADRFSMDAPASH